MKPETHCFVEDIRTSYRWLGHDGHGWTELRAFHEAYRLGREYYRENLRRDAFPKVWYTTRPEQAVAFVKRYWREHTCCYGINPRPQVLRLRSGRNRSAGDNDIRVVMNFYLDIDSATKNPADEAIAELELFLLKTEPYFDDLKVLQPTRAFTGRGYHLLFAPAPILVGEHPDIKERLNAFREQFQLTFAKDLSRLELKLDHTMDLSRVAKIYGTKKPSGQRVSRFYGQARQEDRALREHLLGMSLKYRGRNITSVKIPQSLPWRFERLLEQDADMRQLWHGTGKTEGDTSSSGYDFSLIRRCLRKGITDIQDLAAILALRPKGGYRTRCKGDQYVRLTIANAIKG